MAEKGQDEIAEETIWAAMNLLTTQKRISSEEEKYLKLLELLYPLPGIHKEFILQYLAEKAKITPQWKNNLIEIINRRIALLQPQQKTLIQKRFGIPDGTPHTLQELADKRVSNREKIRKEEIRILRQIQKLPFFQTLSRSLEKIWIEGIKQIVPLDES